MEWSSGARGRFAKRLLITELAILLASSFATGVVYFGKVLPLSASPDPPPGGVSIAWAGQQLQGYTQTTYITAPSCDRPVRVALDLYRMPSTPELVPQVRRPGKIALTIAGDSTLEPAEIRVWTTSHERMSGNRVIAGPGSGLPARREFTAVVHSDRRSGEQRSLTILLDWDPVADPAVNVKFEADWLSNRVPGQSCWLTLPGQLDEGVEAGSIANSALGHRDWTADNRGLPIFNAGTFVYLENDGELEVDASASIPPPVKLAPAAWMCGGYDFQASSCQASVVLRTRDGEASRSRSYVLWSLLGALLLSICAGSLIAALRLLARRR